MRTSTGKAIMRHCKYMLILFCFFCIFFSNAFVNAAEKPEHVVLQLKFLHSFQFAGYYAAKAKGYYTKEGLEVTINERDIKKNHVQHVQTVLDGEARYGLSDTALLLDLAQGKPVVLLKQIFQHSPLVFLSLKGSGIISPDKFIGKRIMFDIKGGDAPLQAMLLDTLGSMENITPVPYSYIYDDLISGKVDVLSAYLTDQPYYYKQRNVAVNIIDPRNYGIDFYGDNLFTSEDEIQNHPERVEKMIRATLRGWDYALKHQAEITDLIIREYNPKLDRQKLLFEARMTEMMILPEIIPLGFVTPYRYERIAQFYKRIGLIKSQINPCGFIYKCSQYIGKKDLPFTPDEKAWLENLDAPLLVANETDWPPFDFAKNGEPKGFSIDLIKLTAEKIGIELEFINGFKWGELLEKFKSKELDILPAVADIPERHDFMLFTSPYITNPSVLVVHDKSTGLNTIEDLEGKRVAIIDGYATATIIKKHYPGIQPVRVDSVLAGLKSVSLGKADAYVGTFGTIAHMLKVNYIPSVRISNESLMKYFKESRLCFGVAKDKTLLHGILQKGMDAVSPDEIQVLRQRWLTVTKSTSDDNTDSVFSAQGKKWIDNHPKLKLGIDPAWPPFEFTDPVGKYSGIASGIVDAVRNQLGIKMIPIPGLTWSQVIARMKKGEIDVLPAVVPTLQRREYMIFTKPYISFPVVIAAHRKIPFVSSFKELERYRVGVIKDYYTEDRIRKDHPYLKLVIFETITQALRQVDSGKVDAFVGNLVTVNDQIHQLSLDNIRISSITGYKMDLCFGVRKNLPELVNILNKSLDNISSQEKAAIKNTWMTSQGIKIGVTIKEILIWAIPISTLAVLIILFVVIWNRGLGKEVSERIKAQAAMQNMMEDLKKAKKEAENATRAKSHFLANMSHEIRTPMNSVIGFLSLSLEDTNISEKQRNYLSIAQNSSETLLNLINDILDVSKLESGKLELEKIPFDLPLMMQKTLNSFDIRAREKNLTLELDIHEDVPRYVAGDPGRLKQILMNLVGNAVKFTEKGSIAVSAVLADRKDFLHFSVADTGVGIPSDRINMIFDPFTQADSSTSRKFGGTGLGTTISRQLTELMDGEIWAESQEGKGSVFHFTACIKASDTRPEDKNGHFSSENFRCFKILVAEDVDENVRLVKIRLEEQGHSIIVARNGKEAVRAFERDKPDIILMDVHMPEMDGLKATMKIREMEAGSNARTPIVALTASLMKEEREVCIKAEMDAVAAKPVNFEKLFAIMEKLVPKGAGTCKQEPKIMSQELLSLNRELLIPDLIGIDTQKGIQTWKDVKVYKKALRSFARDNESAAEKTRAFIENNERENAIRLVHTIKGLAGNLSVTDVYAIADKLDIALRQKKDDSEIIHLIESLADAMTIACSSIKQIEPEKKEPDQPREVLELPVMEELFRDMLIAFEEYNHKTLEPFIEKLDRFFSPDQVDPIRHQVDRFDFDGAKDETVKLGLSLRLKIDKIQ
ncbi:transporter substrate-binding domain-containing protein [Desulfobacterales bacterium HSG17]|nr:transporter substrate-binding domain-containing protein [Desulfobacterales bacterium HSG17]